MPLANVLVDQVVHADGDQNAPQLIQDALNRLSQNPAIANMLNQISAALAASGKTLTITSADINYNGQLASGNPVFDEAMAGYVIPGDSVTYGAFQNGHNGDVAVGGGNFLVYVESRTPWTADNDTPNNSFVSIGFDGYDADFTSTFDRVLFHELVHILSYVGDPAGVFTNYNVFTNNGTPSDTSDDVTMTYAEDIAIIGENFLYAPYAVEQNRTDPGMRLGHGSSADTGGSSGMDAFRFFNNNRSIDSHSASLGYVDFKADSIDGSHLSMKAYNPSKPVQAGTSTTAFYDHYITYDLTYSPSLAATGSLFAYGTGGVSLNGSVTHILSDSLVQPASASSPYASLLDQPKATFDAVHSLSGIAARPGISAFFSKYNILGFETDHTNGLDRMVTLSAERYYQGDFLNHWDVVGPTAAGTRNVAGTVAINESSATQGTLILGASGYTTRYDQPSNTAETSKDSFASSNDWLTGSAYGDVLVAGTGKVANVYNYLDGGLGKDVLIGRSGNDSLIGGGGDDVLITGPGTNMVDGGVGIDVLSYADSATRMYVDLSKLPGSTTYAWSTGTAPAGTSRYDKLIQNIEIVIGSPFADEIRGRGKTLLIGGPGDDVIRLKPGDIAIGGGGHDTFYIDGGGKVAILDLSAEDTLNLGGNYSYDMSYTFSSGYNYRYAFDDNVDGEIGVLTFLGKGFGPNGSFGPRLELFAPINQAYVDSLHLNDTMTKFDRYDHAYVTPSYIFANQFDLGWIV